VAVRRIDQRVVAVRRIDQRAVAVRRIDQRAVAVRRIVHPEVPRQTHHQEADHQAVEMLQARANLAGHLVPEASHPVNCQRRQCFQVLDSVRTTELHHQTAGSQAELAAQQEVQVRPLDQDPPEVLQQQYPQGLVPQTQPSDWAEVRPPWAGVEVQAEEPTLAAEVVQPVPSVVADS
jgi:hypothetical protein